MFGDRCCCCMELAVSTEFGELTTDTGWVGTLKGDMGGISACVRSVEGGEALTLEAVPPVVSIFRSAAAEESDPESTVDDCVADFSSLLTLVLEEETGLKLASPPGPGPFPEKEGFGGIASSDRFAPPFPSFVGRF